MELFHVDRYTGDGDDTRVIPNEEELRGKFLEKINQRKRLSEVQIKDVSELKCKKKKRFEEEDNEKQSEISESIAPVSNHLHKKGKKSKQSGLNSVKSVDNNVKSSSKKKSKENAEEFNGEVEENLKETDNSDNEENEVQTDSSKYEENNSNQTGFTILKDPKLCQRSKVKRKLPNWLANPSVVSVDLKNLTQTVDSIPELDAIFVNKLKENGITHFFPVQQQVIPGLLQTLNRPKMYWPNDICVSAPTGSGKTLAFVLPILQVLYKRIIPRIQALIVLPVQDLANQVYQVFKTYSEPTNLNVILLSKIKPFEEEQELIRKKDDMGNYKTLVDIVVTTAGRLVEHLVKTKGLSFSDLRFLVIDEADKVMDNMQNDWLYHLNKHINSECTRAYQVPIVTYNNLINRKRPPHKLLFSATLSQDPEKLQQMGLFHPKLYTSIVKPISGEVNDAHLESRFIGKYTTPAELKEYYTTCTKANKPLIVHHLIRAESWTKVLCFVNSSIATFKLAYILKHLSNNEIKVKQLSSSLTVKERNSVIEKFHKGKIDILISSDALARGIDIPNVQYVISYDCPQYVKTYVHRIGRTGRAGKDGTSLALLTSKEINSFNKILSNAGKSSVDELKFEEEKLNEYESAFEKALASLAEHLNSQKVQSLKAIKKKKKLQTLASKGKFISKKKQKEKKLFSLKKNKKSKR